MDDEGLLVFSGGQVVTTVVELTDPIRVRSIVPYGQSHKKGDRHRTDQMRIYSAGRLRPAWHDWRDLEFHIESTETVDFVEHGTSNIQHGTSNAPLGSVP